MTVVSKYIGGFQVGDTFRDSGSLHLLPAAVASARTGEGFDFGKGRSNRQGSGRSSSIATA